MIKEVGYYKRAANNIPELNIIHELFHDFEEDQVFLTSSGKAALDIVLSYFRETGNLVDKNSEVWVPKWMESCVYNIMQKKCFPSIVPSESTKGILIYHQYGYPQNLKQLVIRAKENNWFIIEDCAHALMSYYRNKRLGLFGDVGIFSLSKFFPSLMGGVITTKNKDLSEFIKNKLKNTKNWGAKISFISNMFYEKSNNPRVKSFWRKWVEMSYNISDRNLSIYPKSQRVINQCISNRTLDKRNKNQKYFQKQFGAFNVLPEIENHEKVIPYVMPFLVEEKVLMKIVPVLNNLGVRTGIYHFDSNRDMGNPVFENCLWLPVHEGINETIREQMADQIYFILKTHT